VVRRLVFEIVTVILIGGVGACLFAYSAYLAAASHDPWLNAVGPLLGLAVLAIDALAAGILAILVTGPRGVFWKMSLACPFAYFIGIMLMMGPEYLSLNITALTYLIFVCALTYGATATGAICMWLLAMNSKKYRKRRRASGFPLQ
jgi:hypothetical protein